MDLPRAKSTYTVTLRARGFSSLRRCIYIHVYSRGSFPRGNFLSLSLVASFFSIVSFFHGDEGERRADDNKDRVFVWLSRPSLQKYTYVR